MEKKVKKWLIGIGLVLAAAGVSALEMNGVQVPDTAKVGAMDLVLNGAGVRTRAIFKVYVGALYLPEKKTVAMEAIAVKGAKRVALHLLRDLSAEQVAGALDNMSDNLSDLEREKLSPQIAELKATMAAVGEAKEKSLITIDFLPGAGTRVALNGTQKGKTIAGDDLYPALLKIWLGDKPVDRDLKSGMLGAPK